MTSGVLKHQTKWKILAWNNIVYLVFFHYGACIILAHLIHLLSNLSLSLSLSLSLPLSLSLSISLRLSPQHLSNLRLAEAALSHSVHHRLPRLCLHQLCLLSCSWTGWLCHLHGRDTRSASRAQLHSYTVRLWIIDYHYYTIHKQAVRFQ